MDLTFISEQLICWRRNSRLNYKKIFPSFSIHELLSIGSQTTWIFVPWMFIVLLRSSADKEESRCGRQGRTVGLLQDRKKYFQGWGEKERISCFVLLMPTVEELNYIPNSSSASFSMHLIFCIIRENYTLSCCIKDSYLSQSLYFSTVL